MLQMFSFSLSLFLSSNSYLMRIFIFTLEKQTTNFNVFICKKQNGERQGERECQLWVHIEHFEWMNVYIKQIRNADINNTWRLFAIFLHR